MRFLSSFAVIASVLVSLSQAAAVSSNSQKIFDLSNQVDLEQAASTSHYHCMVQKFPKYGQGQHGKAKEYHQCRKQTRYHKRDVPAQKTAMITMTYDQIMAVGNPNYVPRGNLTERDVDWNVLATLSAVKFAVSCGLKYIPKYFMDDKELHDLSNRFCEAATFQAVKGDSKSKADNHVPGVTKESLSIYKSGQWTNMALEWLNLILPTNGDFPRYAKQLCLAAVQNLQDTCRIPLKYGFAGSQTVWSMDGGWVDILAGDTDILEHIPGLNKQSDSSNEYGTNVPMATVDVGIALGL